MSLDLPYEEHCDRAEAAMDWPDDLRWWILLNRLPAGYKMLARKMLGKDWPVLYARHKGKWCRLWTASRFGDIAIGYDLDGQGYDVRVKVSDLADFRTERPI